MNDADCDGCWKKIAVPDLALQLQKKEQLICPT